MFTATKAQLDWPYSRSPGGYGLSPHSLGIYEKNPIKFWFKYCAPDAMKLPRFEQTVPMAVGSAVDGLLKERLAADEWKLNKRLYYRAKVNRSTFGVFGTVSEANRTPWVQAKAEQIMKGILATPVYELLREYHLVDMETDSREATWVHGVPINGKLDFLFRRPGGDPCDIVADLKVNGACSTTGTTPMKGYTHRWDYDPETGEYKECPPHDLAGRPLDELSALFATQLATYGLIEDCREKPKAKINHTPSILVQATFRPAGKVLKSGKQKLPKGKIVFTVTDSYLDGTFKDAVYARYAALWQKITTKTLIPEEYAAMGPAGCASLAFRERL